MRGGTSLHLMVGLAVLGSADRATAQMDEFLGTHELVTLDLDGVIPGTGRIGGITVDSYLYMYVANQDEGVWKIHHVDVLEQRRVL